MPFILALALGSAFVIVVDGFGAWLSVNASVAYELWTPVSFLAYVVVGAALALAFPSLSPVWLDIPISIVEISVTSILAYRIGAFGDGFDELWKQAPRLTVAFTVPIAIIGVGVTTLCVVWGHWLVAS